MGPIPVARRAVLAVGTADDEPWPEWPAWAEVTFTGALRPAPLRDVHVVVLGVHAGRFADAVSAARRAYPAAGLVVLADDGAPPGRAGADELVPRGRPDLFALALRSAAFARDARVAREDARTLFLAEERYRAFLLNSTEGIWRVELEEPVPVDLDPGEQVRRFYVHGYLAECNPAMARMYGFADPADLEGTRLSDLLPPSDPSNVEYLRSFVASGYRLSDAESHEVDRRGAPKTFLNNLVGVIEGGRLVRAWGTQRDVTESRRLEERLRDAQKMEALGRLAGGVAHDFNNMLGVMTGYAQLLTRELGEDTRLRRRAEAILKSADRASDLTRQLLAFSRRQALHPRVIDLDAAVAEIEPLMRRLLRDDVALVVERAPDLRPVRLDPSQLMQIVMNLVLNARDASSPGGRIVVRTFNFDRARGDGGHDPFVGLAVVDRGSGMDAATRARIFEPFFTTKGPGRGTGLGLATVHGIVQQSGGELVVDSEPGRGTIITVFLPRAEEETAPPAPADPVTAVPTER